jgi:hypothetical protein
MQYDFDADTDLNNPPAGTVQPGGLSSRQEDGSQWSIFAMSAAGSALSVLHRDKLRGIARTIHAGWATWNGAKVLELDEDYTKPLAQKEVFRFDPAHDYALCSYELHNPDRDRPGQPAITYDVDHFAKSSAGFFYPAVYRGSSGASGTDKFNNATERAVTTISTYEILSALPAHISDLPKPKGAEYVGDTNEVVQPPAMRVTVLDAKTKKPLANAPVAVRIQDFGGKDFTLTTDANGGINLALPKEEVKYLSLGCDQTPYVPVDVQWRRYANPLRLPAQYEMDLEMGSPISGRIQGEAGQPVEGASVDVSIFGPRDSVPSFSSRWGLFDCVAKTDAQGQWRIDRFPASLDGLCIRVTHPDYEPTTDSGSESYALATPQPLSSLRDGTSVITLKRGNLLGGQTLGSDGKPLDGARLVVGKDIWGTNLPETRSNANGHFVFKGLPSGDNFLTIEAKGHKPKIIPLTLPLTQSMDAIQLAKGRVLRGHVVDAQGKPCAGFAVMPDTWNKLRTLDHRMLTDTNGNFTWDGAPDEPVTFCIAAQGSDTGYISDFPLQASDAVLTISMKPALHLTAKVVDAKTGQPIAKFHVTPGLIFAGNNPAYPNWQAQDAKNEIQGTFDWSSPRIGPSLVFKIEADGYETLISGPYKTTQSDYTATLKLTKAN